MMLFVVLGISAGLAVRAAAQDVAFPLTRYDGENKIIVDSSMSSVHSRGTHPRELATGVPPRSVAAAGAEEGAAPPRWRLILTSDGLTSRGLQSAFKEMLGPEPSSKNVWYIPTAPLRNGWSRGEVRQAAASLKSKFRLGRVSIIDPETVQGERLTAALAELGRVDVVWAEMGNTYALRHQLRASGADAHIYAAMDAGAIYVGSSAGAIVAGRTIQMAFWKNWDDPTGEGTVDVDWGDKEVAAGLDMVGGRSIFPHANGRFADPRWQEEQARRYGHTDHEVIKLADGEGLVVEGDDVRRA